MNESTSVIASSVATPSRVAVTRNASKLVSNNNYLSNADPVIPSRVKRALNDFISGIELKASRIADGQTPDDDMEAQFSELLNEVKRSKPEKLEKLKSDMLLPLESLNTESRFAMFRDIDVSKTGALKAIESELISKHKPKVEGFRDTWVHIPEHVGGIDLISNRFDSSQFVPQRENQGLKFYLSKVKCFDETGSGWGEWGEDEIYCGAVAVDENGNTSSGGLFKVGNFDDGDVKNYSHPGKPLQYFNIHEGGDTFPKIYTLSVSLVEHDYGDLPEWFNKFLDTVRKKVAEYLGALVGAAVGSSLGPLGALIGAAIGWAVGKIISLIKSWLGDEILGYATIRATINGYSGNWIGSGTKLSNLYTRDYRGHSSHYRIYWRCELV